MIFGMARHGKNQKEYLAAEMLLKGSGLNMLDAASLAVELLSLCGGSRSMRRARKAIFLGAEELRKGERTVSFSAAVEEMLKAKRNLRPTTLRDIRYFTGALMRRCPELKGFPVRKLTPEHCAHFLEAAFTSHRQRYKGRAVMSGVLSFSLRRGWCGENPVARVDSPSFRERTIAILAPEEIGSLRTVVEAPEFRDCAPAVWVMLYAGIRPGEVVRHSCCALAASGGIRSRGAGRTVMSSQLAGALEAAPEKSRMGAAQPLWRMECGRAEAYLCFLSRQMVQGFFPASAGDGASFLLPVAGAVPEHGRGEPRQGTPFLGSAGTWLEQQNRHCRNGLSMKGRLFDCRSRKRAA